MNIYVGNLLRTVTESEVQKLFEQYGRVVSVRIIRDRETGISKGYGFVEMPIHTEAELAVAELRGKEFMGRVLRVDEGHGIGANRQPMNKFAKRSHQNGHRQHRGAGSYSPSHYPGEENWRYKYLS